MSGTPSDKAPHDQTAPQAEVEGEQEMESGDVIRTMPESLANQIAAGEVVQRPASVVKECIENSLDAGASSIELIVKDAGRELVQIVDNGCGMSPTDARSCFKRHATSKIRSLDDLERIRTLGFRGEALASIAAVAQVELRTKRPGDDAGFLVDIRGGDIRDARPCATQNGTSVAVRNLFYNVPARRNFLKTPSTEFRHITENFQFLALSNPDVAFSLTHNGNEIYDLPAASGDFHERLARRVIDLFGEQHRDELIKLDAESSYLSARGIIGIPEFHRRSPDQQFLFVNGRHVKSRYLAHAVRNAYGDLLPQGAFPFFALFIELDPTRVDVNVHPAKEEVKFEDQSGLYAFLKRSVREHLGRRDIIPVFDEESQVDGAEPKGQSGTLADETDDEGGTARPPIRFTQFDANNADSASLAPSSSQNQHFPDDNSSPGSASAKLYDLETSTPKDTTPLSLRDRTFSAFHQVGGRFILAVSPETVLLLNQRAAHKRILYDRAMERLDASESTSQQLLFPETISVSRSEYAEIENAVDRFRSLGFDIEPFGGQTIALRGVPEGVTEQNATELFKSILADYIESEGGHSRSPNELLARSFARKGALEAGETLEPEEMRDLLRQLFDCDMPYADPSGAPTLRELNGEDIDLMIRKR